MLHGVSYHQTAFKLLLELSCRCHTSCILLGFKCSSLRVIHVRSSRSSSGDAGLASERLRPSASPSGPSGPRHFNSLALSSLVSRLVPGTCPPRSSNRRPPSDPQATLIDSTHGAIASDRRLPLLKVPAVGHGWPLMGRSRAPESCSQAAIA